MTVVDLISCVRPMRFIQNKKMIARIDTLLQSFNDYDRQKITSKCKILLQHIPYNTNVQALWGFGDTEARSKVLKVLESLGISHYIASQVQDSRFECLCWNGYGYDLTELLECFNMSMDSLTIDVSRDITIFDTALQRIQKGQALTGVEPASWPDEYQQKYKQGQILKTISIEYTPENFIAMHADLRQMQRRVVALYDRTLTLETDLRRSRIMFIDTFDNVEVAVQNIADGQRRLNNILRLSENNRNIVNMFSHHGTENGPSWLVH